MRVQLLVPATIVVSIALLGIMKIREREHAKEDKRNRFQDIKLRVTYDVLREYESEKAEMKNLLDQAQSGEKVLQEEVKMLQVKADEAKGDADICQGAQKSATDEVATVETQFNNLKAETDKETASWKTEMETLKQKLATQSAVCGFLKKGSQAGSKLCGIEVIVEAPKKEEPKPESEAEAPKPKEGKADGPKQEEPKAEQEQPKAEAPKPDAPKQEQPKAEAPKPEAAKQEQPKAEAPKPEAPKQEQPKAEAPKPEEPKAEAPKKR